MRTYIIALAITFVGSACADSKQADKPAAMGKPSHTPQPQEPTNPKEATAAPSAWSLTDNYCRTLMSDADATAKLGIEVKGRTTFVQQANAACKWSGDGLNLKAMFACGENVGKRWSQLITVSKAPDQKKISAGEEGFSATAADTVLASFRTGPCIVMITAKGTTRDKTEAFSIALAGRVKSVGNPSK